MPWPSQRHDYKHQVCVCTCNVCVLEAMSYSFNVTARWAFACVFLLYHKNERYTVIYLATTWVVAMKTIETDTGLLP